MNEHGAGIRETFEVGDDAVYKFTLIPSSKDVYKREVVMDKETFVECFERWIFNTEEIEARREKLRCSTEKYAKWFKGKEYEGEEGRIK